MARANVLGALRGKRAKIHRGSRRRNIKPHQEAEYTSAVVTVDLKLSNPLQSGGVHIHSHMSIEQPQLLAAVNRVERVVDIKHDPFGNLTE